ncbi:MAG: protein kinase [Polyangiaceae bacterium]|nr:protein kinase [Polyangiaceae bacterium]
MRAFDPQAEPSSERSTEIPPEPVGDERQLARARVGQTIQKKWRLDGLLGTGGMAAVYAATHRNGSRAALKIMHRELSADPVIRDRFLREGYVANKVDHTGRVAILDDDITENDEPFLVMELLDGETVQQLWKRKSRRLDVNEALWIAGEVLDVLTAFHAQGIVHRDLKPANVFLTRDGAVKILDYGVARLHEGSADRTRAGTALGTPSFMAPEQAMGLTDAIDGRADVFSMGATLFALLSGQRLHQGRSDNEAFILAATTPAPSLARVAPFLPVDVIALVDKALAWDPRNRFDSAESMHKQVLALLEKHGGPPRQAPITQRPGRPPRMTSDPQALVARGTDTIVDEGKALPNDAVVVALLEVFRRVDKLLPALHHYGKHHPEAETKLRAAHQALVDLLRAAPERAFVQLTPYAFEHRSQNIWEPVGLFEAVPYNMFAAGVRKIAFEPGTTEEELRALAEVMLLDPNRDLLPEDDVAAALWEKQLGHIKCDVLTIFAEGDALERESFFAEADELEAEARRTSEERSNRLEAMAMNVDTDENAVLAAKRAANALALDPAARAALGTQLVLASDRWTERYMDALIDAILTARREGTLSFVSEPLAESMRDLALGKRADTALSMWDTLVHTLETRAPSDRDLGRDLTRAMFGTEALRHLLKEVSQRHDAAHFPPASGIPGPTSPSLVPPPVSQLTPSGRTGNPLDQRMLSNIELLRIAEHLTIILQVVDPSSCEVIAQALPWLAHDGVRRASYEAIERSLSGNEDRIADVVLTFEPDVARPILKMLAASPREEAKAALQRIARSKNPALRCEAVAHAARNADELRDELMKLTEAEDSEVRFAALRTLAAHKVRAAGPLLVKRISDPTFQSVSPAEQRELLEALFALHPLRGETLAIEIVQKHGIMPDESLDVTRQICAELLGRESKADDALTAVLEAAKRRWWNGPALRDTAQKAAERIAQKLGKPLAKTGEAT